MKRIAVLVLLFVFAGCCKMYCDGTDLVVSFEKFKATETDTVLFVRYLPNTNQTQVVDTARITTQISPADTSRSAVARSLSSAYDWKVLLPAAGRQYVFEHFDFTTEKCNCGGKKYKAIRSFSVNGTRKEGLFLALE